MSEIIPPEDVVDKKKKGENTNDKKGKDDNKNSKDNTTKKKAQSITDEIVMTKFIESFKEKYNLRDEYGTEHRGIYGIRDSDDIFIYDFKKGCWTRNVWPYIKESLVQTWLDIPVEDDTAVEGVSYKKCNCSKLASDTRIKTIINRLQGDKYIDMRDFKERQGIVILRNCAFDLNKDKPIEHNRNYFSKRSLSFDYDPDAKCPNFINFLGKIFDKEQIKRQQKWHGYHLMSGQKHRKIMIYAGPKRAGKSTYIHVAFDDFFDEDKVCHHELQEFNNSNSHALIDLCDKYACTYADLSSFELKDVGKIKMLAGGDSISARYHYAENFPFENNAKISLACNEFPKLTPVVEKDEAFWDRIIIEILESKIDIKDVEGLRTNILEERSGIFNWSTEGYRLLQEEGFNYEGDVAYEQWQTYSLECGTFNEFINDTFVFDKNSYIDKDDVQKLYDIYCNENNIEGDDRIYSSVKFGRSMSDHNVALSKQTMEKGLRKMVWKGIKAKETIQDIIKNELVNVSDYNVYCIKCNKEKTFLATTENDILNVLKTTMGKHKDKLGNDCDGILYYRRVN